ncbi:hypothetical protein DFH27DRAFT_600790 [Peziza echinospora]|nr:hypothetical protein DFH27DRAFT_600790 [Peziza echinospora]
MYSLNTREFSWPMHQSQASKHMSMYAQNIFVRTLFVGLLLYKVELQVSELRTSTHTHTCLVLVLVLVPPELIGRPDTCTKLPTPSCPYRYTRVRNHQLINVPQKTVLGYKTVSFGVKGIKRMLHIRYRCCKMDEGIDIGEIMRFKWPYGRANLKSLPELSAFGTTTTATISRHYSTIVLYTYREASYFIAYLELTLHSVPIYQSIGPMASEYIYHIYMRPPTCSGARRACVLHGDSHGGRGDAKSMCTPEALNYFGMYAISCKPAKLELGCVPPQQ